MKKNTRGVWSEPLLPGKYAFNTYAGKVLIVPTTNFILKWNKSESGSHKFDENLTEVSLITKDAFEPSLPLSVVVHIDYRKAPLVIQRFGDIKRLVEQTLDPMVSAYFKNIGQTRTLIQLIQERSAIQQISGEQMKEKFAHYNLELQEVLIGTPTSGVQGSQIETDPDAAALASDRRGAGRDLHAAGEGRDEGAGAARGRVARQAADAHHRVGALDQYPVEPGQGRVPSDRDRKPPGFRRSPRPKPNGSASSAKARPRRFRRLPVPMPSGLPGSASRRPWPSRSRSARTAAPVCS